MNNVFKALSKDQENFLNSDVDFALYGGGIGAGKLLVCLAVFSTFTVTRVHEVSSFAATLNKLQVLAACLILRLRCSNKLILN